MPTFPFYIDDKSAGSISVDHDGLNYVITVECTGKVDINKHKAYAIAGGLRGARLPVGSFSQHGDIYKAKRMITRAELAQSGLLADLIDCGGAFISDQPGVEKKVERPSAARSEWRHAENPETMVSDPPLIDCLRDADGILYKDSRDCTLLAAPLVRDKPFALSPAFTIIRVVRINNASFGILKLDKAGYPVY